jgi:superfamily II DNA or RNA helicase
MKDIISLPETSDEQFQKKIYEKREYYSNRIGELSDLKTYKDIKKYRDTACTGTFKLQPYQTFLSNFINPNTPYTGVLITHGAGSGKSAAAIAVCENFKPLVKKHNTKMYILVPGPLNKENWKRELIKSTGNTYITDTDSEIKSDYTKYINNALQYYRIISYKGFYKKVLGQKIIEKKEKNKKTYKKTEEGAYIRDLSIDRLNNLNNSVLVIDEAHNITDNEYGLAVKKIIEDSVNLRIILLTATPMKNLADDVIELLNYLRPKNDKIIRDKIFTIESGHKMNFKPNGLEYLKKMAQGYVSYYRGINPLTYATQVDKGELVKGLLFTPVISCDMLEWQAVGYASITDNIKDALDRKSASIANFAIPILDSNNKELIAISGREGLRAIKIQLGSYKNVLLEKIKNKFFPKETELSDIVKDQNNTISGLIFKQPYLKNFSVKFDKCLNNLYELNGTAFIYSNLVKSGIELFEQVLLNNGFLEYREDQYYDITDDILDYKTMKPYGSFKNKDYFKPATYIKITGKAEDAVDADTDEKIKILDNIFSSIENVEGKYIKCVLGSKVMNEGITLRNVKEVHILDVHYNLGKVYQVIGRAIRHCVHNDIMTEETPYIYVNVYRYVISILGNKEKLTSEEELYKKAETKYILIKQVERALKEVAIDCPLNYNGNIIKDEVEKNKDCIPVNQETINSKNLCPVNCDFNKCNYICNDNSLNLKYYDKDRKIYKRIARMELDYSTFNNDLALNEINIVKSKIKKLFKYRYVYTLDEIIDLAAKDIDPDLFDVFFVYRALDVLIPITENDFNKFKDIIYDKHNIPGYLIYRNKYYIFQPFNQNEDVLMYYRSNYDDDLYHEISVRQYLDINNININNNNNKYEYALEYYNNKKDYIYVGLIEKAVSSRGNKEEHDIFKIRPRRENLDNKKRGYGITSEKGALCVTYKDRNELLKIAKQIGISKIDVNTRLDICNLIKERLLYLEKYSEDNFTYMIIPINHPDYEYPYNLLDRIEYYKQEINKLIDISDYIVDKLKDKSYNLKFKNESAFDKYINNIKKLGFKLQDKFWIKKID